MGTAAYFQHIKEALATIFDGMAVTASHMIRKPYTIQYPDRIPVRVQDTLPFRYRGILDVDLEICTGCLACDRACPIDCIAMAIEKNAVWGRRISQPLGYALISWAGMITMVMMRMADSS